MSRDFFFPRPSSFHAFDLDTIPSVYCIKAALFAMNGTKASGIDDLPTTFFQHNWEFIKDSFCEVIRGAFTGTFDISTINQTLLVLILKVEAYETISQLRPISLFVMWC